MAEPIVSRVHGADLALPADTVVIKAAPRKKPRPWLGWLIALMILVLLLVIFVVADMVARQYATSYVRDKIIDVLELDPASEVDVDLGSGSLLFQAARGTIDRVSIHVPRLILGEVVGEAEIMTTMVPLDRAKPVNTLSIEVTVTEANVQKLSGFLSGTDLKSIELNNGMIRIGTEVDLFLAKIPVAVDLLPSAQNGGIRFRPQTVLLGDREISVADLRAIPGIQDLAGGLLGSRDFCVADSLPKAFRVDDVDVVDTDLVVLINGDGAVLGGSGLSTKGTCPAA